ncbi:hypothetical protein HV213_15595 [Klebsiella sp. RHBSTW-00484]|uniref:hypothetical protein n=1 Tax=unclassified Klebsiella TaxID=2608929 RepID=UPI0015E4BC9D|nr:MULTISPECIES: hypothetical protein [unclassified Klebsiella]MBA7846948.1 hypothetical protein [Klebsiella sp. RHBSTW-00465]QLO37141.1 hypothetical protein HV213_15595 [Klebsiella sp. RHBSTW-00484]QLT76659.1 hypothetical protein HV204_15595 [Klebsiella sp. RHBSTW-00464]
MRKKSKIVFLVLGVVACGAAFTLWKWQNSPACDKAQLAINEANFFILTRMLPFTGELRSVQISGEDNQYHTKMIFSRCGMLESRVSTRESDFGGGMASSSKIKLSRNSEDDGKGWVQEITIVIDSDKKESTLTTNRYFHTDELGRIAWSEEYKTGKGKPNDITTWRYRYDDQHRLVREYDVDSPQKVFTDFSYNENGRLNRVASTAYVRQSRWDRKGRWLSDEAEYGNAKLILENVCSAWDNIGNCTLADIITKIRSADGEYVEKGQRLQRKYQYEYQ